MNVRTVTRLVIYCLSSDLQRSVSFYAVTEESYSLRMYQLNVFTNMQQYPLIWTPLEINHCSNFAQIIALFCEQTRD